MHKENADVDVAVGEQLVSIKRAGHSAVVVAGILGQEVDEHGKQTIYLDRLVHRTWEHQFRGWDVSGAISTVIKQH